MIDRGQLNGHKSRQYLNSDPLTHLAHLLARVAAREWLEGSRADVHDLPNSETSGQQLREAELTKPKNKE
jgi:hypothetical protein